MQNIWAHHAFLNAGFWKEVILVPANIDFTFVPSSLVNNEIRAVDYLKLNCDFNLEESIVKQFKLNNLQVTCCFTLSKSLMEWMTSYYPTITTKIIHNNCCFLWGLLKSKLLASSQSTLFVNTEEDLVTIAALNGQKLNFINTYQFQNEDDFVYYIMLVLEELKIPVNESQVKIWGDLDEESECLPKLESYVDKLELGRRPLGLKFNYHFDELPEHYNFDILSAFDMKI